MTSCSPLSRLLWGLVACALMLSQVFGVPRGYLCDCSGEKQAVQEAHCDGPHGAQCHSSNLDRADDGDHHEHPARKDHEIQIDRLQGGTVSSVVSVPIAALTLIAVLPDLLSFGTAQEISAPITWIDALGGASPPSLYGTRTVVLLI